MAGGTLLTITGRFFGNVQERGAVKVAGVPCLIVSLTRTQIQCVTGPNSDSYQLGDVFPGNWLAGMN